MVIYRRVKQSSVSVQHPTDRFCGATLPFAMENLLVPAIVEADRMRGGVIVYFADGRQAVYPAALLYAALELAKIMSDDSNDEALSRTA
jgi:hypothetical protein